MKKIFVACLIISLALVVSSCNHRLRITNLHDNYTSNPAPLKNGITIGISSDTESYDDIEYIQSIIVALKLSDNFDKIIYPYNRSYGNVDYVLDISAKPHYSGRKSNFFVNWPGFLIFAPAIWGYGYNASIMTDVNISKGKSKEFVESINIKANYDFRHAAINRTWTEIGWFELGITPLIGGFFFTKYDQQVTREFIRAVSNDYGTFIARKIISKIGNSQLHNNDINSIE